MQFRQRPKYLSSKTQAPKIIKFLAFGDIVTG